MGLKKSLCRGCLKARYCSLECQGSDWEVHGNWCERRREKNKKKMEEKRRVGRQMMEERARGEVNEDTIVD